MDIDSINNRAQEAFSKNFFKALLVLIVFSVLTIILSSFITVGLLSVGSSSTILFSFILIIWFYVLFFMLQYGLSISVYKMTTKQHVVLGHLFSGFKKFRQLSGAALLTFFGIFVLNLILLSPYILFDSSFTPLFTYSLVDKGIDLEFKITILFIVTILIYLGFLLFFSLLFAFIPYIFEQNPQIKVFKAYKGCVILLKGRIIHFFVCLIKGVWPFLVAEIIALLLLFINIISPLPLFLMKITSFVHTISSNLLFLKVLFVSASYYASLYELRHKNFELEDGIVVKRITDISESENIEQRKD